MSPEALIRRERGRLRCVPFRATIVQLYRAATVNCGARRGEKGTPRARLRNAIGLADSCRRPVNCCSRRIRYARICFECNNQTPRGPILFFPLLIVYARRSRDNEMLGRIISYPSRCKVVENAFENRSPAFSRHVSLPRPP